MPPQITFIKLTERTALPIKIFVKYSGSEEKLSNVGNDNEHHSLAINSKSLITLTNATKYHTRLSKNYLNTLVNESLSEDLKETLLTTPIKDLKIRGPITNTTSSTVVRTIQTPSRGKSVGHASLHIPLVLLVNIRVRYSRLSHEDAELLQLKGLVSTKAIRPDGTFSLLEKSTTMDQEVTILREEEDGVNDVEEEVDAKKNVGYKVSRLSLFSNLSTCIKVYLTHA